MQYSDVIYLDLSFFGAFRNVGGALLSVSYKAPPAVLIVDKEMQKVTGTISPGGHPGSYNGQDAYNDLLVVGNANDNDKPQRLSHESGNERNSGRAAWDGSQRPTGSNDNRGGHKCLKMLSVG